MNITCAYCHIKGHHIKFCAELIEKNRRRDAYKNKMPPMAVRSSPIVKPSPKKTSNIFANLDEFSSEEEGEIVEEESKFRRKSLEDDASLTGSETSCSVGSETSCSVGSETSCSVGSETSCSVGSETSCSVNSWSRRGTKGIVVHIPQVTCGQDLDSDEEYTPSEEFLRFLEASREFLSQYAGVAWIDI
jgi:predicted nucleic acid-binding Zn ribbon protein